jgi:hypothetical protein
LINGASADRNVADDVTDEVAKTSTHHEYENVDDFHDMAAIGILSTSLGKKSVKFVLLLR